MPPRAAKSTAAGDNAGDGPAINGQTATPSEIKFILAMLGNLKVKPEINWDGVAATLGTEKKSAAERWRLIRIKFGLNFTDNAKDNAGDQAAPGTARKTPAAKKKTPAAANANNEEDAGTASPAAPATPAPKRGRKAAGTATATPTPRASTGRKRALTNAAAAAASPAAADGGEDAEVEASPAKKVKGKAAGVTETPTKTKVVPKKNGAAAADETEAGNNDVESSPLSSLPETVKGEHGNEMEE